MVVQNDVMAINAWIVENLFAMIVIAQLSSAISLSPKCMNQRRNARGAAQNGNIYILITNSINPMIMAKNNYFLMLCPQLQFTDSLTDSRAALSIGQAVRVGQIRVWR